MFNLGYTTKKAERFRRQLDEEDIDHSIAEDLATNGEVVPNDKVGLYRQAAALVCSKLGLGSDYYIVTVPQDQTYCGSPVPEGKTRITIEGEQGRYGSGKYGGVLGAAPLYHALAELESQRTDEFPLYKMLIDSEEHWLPLRRAGVAYDSGSIPVEIGGAVLDGAGVTREITDEERSQISDIADEYSASK